MLLTKLSHQLEHVSRTRRDLSFISLKFVSLLIVHSENAASYNTRFEKTIQQIIEEIIARKDWIGVNWSEETSDDESANTTSTEPKKPVRLLDYACGTGLVSRVRFFHQLDSQHKFILIGTCTIRHAMRRNRPLGRHGG